MKAPTLCKSCVHRQYSEEGPGIAAGIPTHKCRMFTNDATGPLHCAYVFSTYCGGAEYRPTFWRRVATFFGRA